MKFDKQSIEVIGILGVIASLTFVGMQLMLDRQVALADQYFNRTESRLATVRSQLESEAYIDLMVMQWENGSRPAFLSGELELLIPENYSPRNNVTALLDFQASHELALVSMPQFAVENDVNPVIAHLTILRCVKVVQGSAPGVVQLGGFSQDTVLVSS